MCIHCRYCQMTDADKSFLEAARTGDTEASIFVTMGMNGHAQSRARANLAHYFSECFHNMNIKSVLKLKQFQTLSLSTLLILTPIHTFIPRQSKITSTRVIIQTMQKTRLVVGWSA